MYLITILVQIFDLLKTHITLMRCWVP